MDNFCDSKTAAFDPKTSIPPLNTKTILITGANSGLGFQAALTYAQHSPKTLYIAARSLSKAQSAADAIKAQIPDANLKPLQLELASFASIKKAAKTFLENEDRLNILMLNAGIMGTAPGLTEDGYEIQWGVNHMGHALLTRLLMPALNRTANARIVSLSSHGHKSAKPGSLRLDDSLKSEAVELGAYGRYFQSKLANVLWVRHMAKVHPHLTMAAVHPGVVQTQLVANGSGTPWYVKGLVKLGYGFLKKVEDGVKNQLWASVSDDVVSGEYYDRIGKGGLASEDGKDDDLARRLWEWTERELESIAVERKM